MLPAGGSDLLAQPVAALSIALGDTQMTFPRGKVAERGRELRPPVFTPVPHPARHRAEQVRLGHRELSTAVQTTLSEHPPPEGKPALLVLARASLQRHVAAQNTTSTCYNKTAA
jgi:hypothetical protein